MEKQFLQIWTGFHEKDIKGYKEQYGDLNPIHWDEAFFRKNPKYSRFTRIRAPIVPGALIAEHIYKEIKRRCAYGFPIWLEEFDGNFVKPLYVGAKSYQYRWGYERSINGERIISVSCEVENHLGEPIAEFAMKFLPKEQDPAQDNFALSRPLAKLVWWNQGNGVLLQWVHMRFERVVKLGEKIDFKFSAAEKGFTFLDQKRVHQLNLQAISRKENKSVASYTVRCFDCSDLLLQESSHAAPFSPYITVSPG